MAARFTPIVQSARQPTTEPATVMPTYTSIADGLRVVTTTSRTSVIPGSGKNDGSGGAYHHGCDFTSGGVMYVDATFANTTANPLDLEVSLYIAELSECCMGAQGRGWGCGSSNGEGLSRFLAENSAPPGFANSRIRRRFGFLETWGLE